MSLKPRSPNITFLDLETLQPKCTFNDCIRKFKLNEDVATKRTVSRGRPMAAKPIYVYQCSECGRRVQEAALDDNIDDTKDTL
jgi:uncharacterized protein YlaI